MALASRYDAWQVGDSYDLYMGRWSRQIAPRFLDWLEPEDGLDWLDVGCGTGSLTERILAETHPRSLLAVDPSETFLDKARSMISDPRVEFRAADAQELPLPSGSRDMVVSALVLNFIPDKQKALFEMLRVLRPRGKLAFYVWDYPGGGVEFLRAFWKAAAALDPAASELAENRRFPFCTQDALVDLAIGAGLRKVESVALEAPTTFKSFDDLWQPFTQGTGPAPGYCTSLDDAEREALKENLRQSLTYAAEGSIPLKTRAWAVRGHA